MPKLPRFLLSICAAFLVSCNLLAEPANLSLLKQKVRVYHDSGAYQRDLQQVIDAVRRQLIKARQAGSAKKLALVLDIDETSLSNYNFMANTDFSGDKIQIDKHILAADDLAIKPTLNLYNYAIAHGINVFFVTGRKKYFEKATVRNLHQAGYHNWTGLYFKPDNYKPHSVIPFKSHARAVIMAKGFTIVANVGDQFSDIKGGYQQKGYKLPNPFYYLP